MSNFNSFGDTARLLEARSHNLSIFRSLAPQNPTFPEKLNISTLLSRRCVQVRPPRTSFSERIDPSGPTLFLILWGPFWGWSVGVDCINIVQFGAQSC